MKKPGILIFFGLLAMLLYTAFSMQNRMLVPIRLTFDKPFSCFLPVVVLCSFIAGILFCAVFMVVYYTGNKKVKIQPAVSSEINNGKKTYSFHSSAVKDEKRKGGIELTGKLTNRASDGAVSGGNQELDTKPAMNIIEAKTQHNNASIRKMENRAEVKDVIECIKCKKEINDLVKLLSKSNSVEGAQQ